MVLLYTHAVLEVIKNVYNDGVNHIISYDMIKEDGKNYILLCLDPAEIKYLNERYKDITIDIEQAIKQLILSSKYEYKKRGTQL